MCFCTEITTIITIRWVCNHRSLNTMQADSSSNYQPKPCSLHWPLTQCTGRQPYLWNPLCQNHPALFMKSFMSKSSVPVFVMTPCSEMQMIRQNPPNVVNISNQSCRRIHTFSVMIPLIKLAGVTSKAGFHTEIPDAATCSPSPPRAFNISLGDLSSIMISFPEERDESKEVSGAAT